MSAGKLAARTLAAVAGGLELPAFLRKRRRRRCDFRFFILEYHAVVSGREFEGAVGAERFRAHLDWLAARFRCVTVAQGARRLQGGLDEDLLAITFDDGYADNARVAFPLLAERRLPATIYLATGFLDGRELWFDVARRGLAVAARDPGEASRLDRLSQTVLSCTFEKWPTALPLEEAMQRLKNAPATDRLEAVQALRPLAAALPPKMPMAWDEARSLRDAGIELGAHTVDHPILSKLSEGEQEKQIAGSLERIEEELGERPQTFAMPNGGARDYDRATLHVLRRLGLLAACTTRRGANADGAQLMELKRIGVGSDSPAMLDARLAGFFDEGMRKIFT